MHETQCPFGSAVSVTERLAAIRDWPLAKCQVVLAAPAAVACGLQPSVAKALEARIRRLSKEGRGSKYITGGCLKALIGQKVELVTRRHRFVGTLRDVDDTGNAHTSSATLVGPDCAFTARTSGKVTAKTAVCPMLNQISQVWLTTADGQRRVF